MPTTINIVIRITKWQIPINRGDYTTTHLHQTVNGTNPWIYFFLNFVELQIIKKIIRSGLTKYRSKNYIQS